MKPVSVKNLILSILFFSTAFAHSQQDVLIVYKPIGGTNATFNCVQDYAGTNGNFILCDMGGMGGATNIAPPPCMVALNTYDIVMVQATYTNVSAAFIAQLVTYIQGGGSVYFQNDCAMGPFPEAQQNMNNLLASIGQAGITLSINTSIVTEIPTIGGVGAANYNCPLDSAYYNSGGSMSGPALANATTGSLSVGIPWAFWPTGFGGILGLGTEFFSSGNWPGYCQIGSGKFIWDMMNGVTANCEVVAEFSLSADSICVGDCIDITDLSVSTQGTVISWNYQIAGGTPLNAVVQNPTNICFNAAGVFDIVLTVEDDLGYMDDTTVQITVVPCDCNIDSLHLNIGPCQPLTNTYCVDGFVDFSYPPATGTLIVEVDNGTTIYDTIINLPFISGQTWSICGIPADGSASTVTVYFSDEIACSSTIAYSAPWNCACYADLGTFNATMTGNSTNNYILCFGDQISINSNNDWTGPGEMFNPPGSVYNPGVSWLIYSCPPTVATVPHPVDSISDDPCFLGFVSNTNFVDVNDLSWINSFPGGTFTDNIIYWVPITMYDQTGEIYSYVNGTALPCYEMGAPYAVQYLPEFTSSFTDDCLAGTADITLNGGLPELDGSNFTASNLFPAAASFVNTTATDGGIIQISGLKAGDMWSFDVDDGNGCPYSVSGGPFPPLENPGFNYAQTSWCTSAPPMDPTITGVTGGTFTSTPTGLTLDGASGEITPTTSAPGTYNVTYTTPGVCFDDSTMVVNIAEIPIVSFIGTPLVGCEPLTVEFTNTTAGSPGQSCIWDFGDGNSTSGCGTVYNTYMAGTYSVSLTVTTAENCAATETYVDYVSVTASPKAQFTFSPQQIEATNPEVEFDNNSTNATSYLWDFGDNSANSTTENPIHLYPEEPGEEYLVTLYAYNANGSCSDSTSQIIGVDDIIVFYIPNVMTPDGDLFNESFQPVFTAGFDKYDYHLTIFNRWGEVVFESFDANYGWNGHYADGELVQDGTYIWQIDFKETMSDKRHLHRGHVTVLK